MRQFVCILPPGGELLLLDYLVKKRATVKITPNKHKNTEENWKIKINAGTEPVLVHRSKEKTEISFISPEIIEFIDEKVSAGDHGYQWIWPEIKAGEKNFTNDTNN